MKDHLAPLVSYAPQRVWNAFVQHTGTGVYGSHSWSNLHLAHGVFDWDYFDQIVNQIIANGHTDIFYTFGYTPAWVTGGTLLAEWGNFVAAIVAHSAGRVKVWGLWNEPGGNTTPMADATLASMAAIAYPIINAAGQLLTSPEYHDNASGNLTVFLNGDGGAYFDIMATHLYDVPDPDLSVTSNGMHAIIDSYIALRVAFGLTGKPWWNTEFNELGLSAFGGTEAQNQRDFISQVYPLLWAKGIDRNYWYGWDTAPDYGQLWDGAVGKNVAGVAHDTVRGWLLGKTASAWQRSGSAQWVDLVGPSGYVGRIVWQFKGTSTYTIPAGAWTRKSLVDGSTAVIAGGTTSITIGQTAILIDNQ